MRELDILKTLVPVHSLGSDNFKELAAKTRIERFPAETTLFQQGDNDRDTFYLLAGEVELTASQDNDIRRVVAGSDKARYALAQLKPRQYTGVAHTDVMLARLDSATLDRLLTFDQATGYEVTEFDATQDTEWMWRMLTDKAFHIFPPENINTMFTRVEQQVVKAGQVIIRQGDPGDYYYIIKSGRATVARKSDTGKVVVLAELGETQAFGEEALLSGAPRNATVIMKTDGVLMRLAKHDFDELLKAPALKTVSYAEAMSLVKAKARLLDVRLEEEYRVNALPGSQNVPLFLLRQRSVSLDPGTPYIVCCQTGSRSTVAAFLLSQRGFDARVLHGGLDAIPRGA